MAPAYANKAMRGRSPAPPNGRRLPLARQVRWNCGWSPNLETDVEAQLCGEVVAAVAGDGRRRVSVQAYAGKDRRAGASGQAAIDSVRAIAPHPVVDDSGSRRPGGADR